MNDDLKIALAQLSPVWLNKAKTIDKALDAIHQAASKKADLIIFGEGFLPGYPFWLSTTNGSEFESKIQKEIHAHYVRNSILIEQSDLDSIKTACKKGNISCYLGIIERAEDRGGHSLYCSLVYINNQGEIKSVHRKLQPTYEERLTWSSGDGHGLVTHKLKDFTLGGLNCWENWMPLARTALYGQGENLHVAVWPGSKRNTEDITRFIAKESRSYVVSVSSLMRKEDFPDDTPHLDLILKNSPEILANGGSCLSAPNGEWVIEPIINSEKIIYADINVNLVYEERQNFDPSGHYSRPDITSLSVNRKRQSTVEFKD